MPNPYKFPLAIFLCTVLLCLLYIFISFNASPTPVAVRLGIAQLDYERLILVTVIAIPLFAALFFGLWSFMLLRRVAAEEKKEKEARGFRLLASGMLVVTLTLIIGIGLSQVRSYVLHSGHGIVKTLTILINYVYTFGYLMGFYILFRSTRKLAGCNITKWNLFAGGITTLLIWIFYVIILFTNPDRIVSTVPGAAASQYLSDPLIFLTIALPTLVAWFFAITTAFNLADTYGLIAELRHRHGLKHIFYGELIIIASQVILQAILSVGVRRFLDLGLAVVLIVLYLFVFLLASGYGFMAIGARKLSIPSKI